MPLFNGAKSDKLTIFEKYLGDSKIEKRNKNFGGLFKIKHKNHFIIIDVDKPPQKNSPNPTSQVLYPSNIFRRNKNNY